MGLGFVGNYFPLKFALRSDQFVVQRGTKTPDPFAVLPACRLLMTRL
jgi:hypothetical protein